MIMTTVRTIKHTKKQSSILPQKQSSQQQIISTKQTMTEDVSARRIVKGHERSLSLHKFWLMCPSNIDPCQSWPLVQGVKLFWPAVEFSMLSFCSGWVCRSDLGIVTLIRSVLNSYWLMIVFVCPGVTMCGWQEIKIQLLTANQSCHAKISSALMSLHLLTRLAFPLSSATALYWLPWGF